MKRWPALLLLCSQLSCGWWQGRGRIYTDHCTYAGIRGHTDLQGIAITGMIETDAPLCRYIYPEKP